MGKMARCLCRVNARAETGVLVVGFERLRELAPGKWKAGERNAPRLSLA